MMEAAISHSTAFKADEDSGHGQADRATAAVVSGDELPVLSAEARRLANFVHARRRGRDIRIGDGVYDLAWHVMDGGFRPFSDGRGYRLFVDGIGGRLSVNNALMMHLLQRSCPDIQCYPLPADLIDLVLVGELEKCCGYIINDQRVRLVADEAGDRPCDGIAVGFRAARAGHPMLEWRVGVPPPLAGFAEAVIERQFPRVDAIAGWIAIPVTVSFGRIVLSQADLGKAKPGDLLIAGRGSGHRIAARLSAAGSGLANVSIEENGTMTITDIVDDRQSTGEDIHDEEAQVSAPLRGPDPEGGEATEAPLDTDRQSGRSAAAGSPGETSDMLPPMVAVERLAVPVSFELARLNMRIDAISQLGVGSVMDLGRRLTDPVSIVANGAVIGRGTLVQIDDYLGVRISEMAAGNDRV